MSGIGDSILETPQAGMHLFLSSVGDKLSCLESPSSPQFGAHLNNILGLMSPPNTPCDRFGSSTCPSPLKHSQEKQQRSRDNKENCESPAYEPRSTVSPFVSDEDAFVSHALALRAPPNTPLYGKRQMAEHSDRNAACIPMLVEVVRQLAESNSPLQTSDEAPQTIVTPNAPPPSPMLLSGQRASSLDFTLILAHFGANRCAEDEPV